MMALEGMDNMQHGEVHDKRFCLVIEADP